MTDSPTLHWQENEAAQHARWRSEAGVPPPARVVVADDRMRADEAYRLACAGTALLWRGDFQNARQLLQAMGRRAETKAKKAQPGASITDAFHRHRMAQAQRARTLGLLLIPLAGDYTVPLRRAPDVAAACVEAWGEADGEASVVSLRELQGLIGAHEWRKKGVAIPALGGACIHPHYGVFSPVRGEYVDLVAAAPLPAALQQESLAFDVGTGTGVLAALLARRGVKRVLATDRDPRALACARANVERLGFGEEIEVVEADLFPAATRAPLVVCNPPWLPGKAATPVEGAVYDPDSRMLKGFLMGLKDHLAPGGEGWLILSDFAEHLGLRKRGEVLALIEAAGLKLVARTDIRPRHPKASDTSDPLYLARVAEKTSLWRLALP